MKDLVSIIIPMYQAENTIERCVQSLVNGTYQNIEIILIDDCSRDQSYDIGLQLEQKYKQVQCVKNERNSGVSATRNKGLAAAQGTYLMFVDSDDWVELDFVECMIENTRQNIMPVCGYVNHDEVKNGRTDIFGWSDKEVSSQVPLEKGILELYQNRLLQMIWNKVFLLDVIRENKLEFDTSLHCGEDFRFLLAYLKLAKINAFLFMKEVLYHYSRDNESSLATKFTEVALEAHLYNLEQMYLLSGKAKDEVKKQMVQEREQLLYHYAYSFMHNEKLSNREKKKKIMELPLDNVRKVYRELKVIYWKENLRRRIER